MVENPTSWVDAALAFIVIFGMVFMFWGGEILATIAYISRSKKPPKV